MTKGYDTTQHGNFGYYSWLFPSKFRIMFVHSNKKIRYHEAESLNISGDPRVSRRYHEIPSQSDLFQNASHWCSKLGNQNKMPNIMISLSINIVRCVHLFVAAETRRSLVHCGVGHDPTWSQNTGDSLRHASIWIQRFKFVHLLLLTISMTPAIQQAQWCPCCCIYLLQLYGGWRALFGFVTIVAPTLNPTNMARWNNAI